MRVNVDAFEKLDRIIHEQGRMAIMSLLAASEMLSFKELKDLLGMTDGNLSVHMRKLEESGYVAVHKSFVNRKPRTEFSLTAEGRAAFESYIAALEQIVEQNRAVERPVRAEAPAPRRELGIAPG